MRLAELQTLSYWPFTDVDALIRKLRGPRNQGGGTLEEPEELNKPCFLSPPCLLSLLFSLLTSFLCFLSPHDNNNKPSF